MYFDDYENSEVINIFNINGRVTKEYDDISNGLVKGTIFNNEYKPYKNYAVRPLTSTSKEGELLLKIYELDFAINDLNLYLDLHPENKEAYQLFCKYVSSLKNYTKDYEFMYGPLKLMDSDYPEYRWNMDPWPWENVKESTYV